MLITFKAQAHSDVTMFGKPALKLLCLMGRTETLPSAMEAEDIPNALTLLRLGIVAADGATEKDVKTENDITTSYETDAPVSLHTRALPLIELLQAAYRDQVPVMWEQGARAY